MSSVYFFTWQIDPVTYDLPVAGLRMIGPSPPGTNSNAKYVSLGQIAHAFPADSLSRTPALAFARDKVALPPGTELAVTAPDIKRLTDQVGVISLKNGFCRITIKTERRGGMGGLGEYDVMAGGDGQSLRQGFLMYDLSFTAEFSSWRTGDPEMPKYVQWASTMLNQMRDNFDEQTILRRSRELHSNPKHRPPPRFTAPQVEKPPRSQQHSGEGK